MEQVSNAKNKYENYREQMGRLNKAICSQFYLEAIFIEYAILEDRLESIILHSGKWNYDPDRFVSIDTKLRKVSEIAREKKSTANKYFKPELMEEISNWKNERNRLIHALLKQTLHTPELKELAENGKTLVKTLCSKSTSYNRAIEKQSLKSNGGKNV